MFRRTFKNHVFEQVGHARFPVILMARTNQIRHVDGDRLLGRVGEKQYGQTIRHSIFRDALDRRNLFNAARQFGVLRMNTKRRTTEN